MSSPTEKLDIVVGNFPADAALYNINGVRTLFMGSGQTFSRAVANVRNVLPGITLEAAERMIREQCPEFRDFDDLLGLNNPTPPSVERTPAGPADDNVFLSSRRRRRNRKAALVAALLPALAASWALGRYSDIADPAPTQAKASAPDVKPGPDNGGAGPAKIPFTDPKFEFFSGSSSIECAPISALEAECTDSDGMVMATKAATGPDSTIFTFSYGSERIGLRIFYDARYAETWARQDGSRELYPNMKVNDRYVLWGTDPDRIGEYARLLEEAARHKSAAPVAMGGLIPLPPRLAALTLGTLGFDNREVTQIIARPAEAATDAPVMIAARLVLGLETLPEYVQHDSDDIVALAAGIGPPPVPAGAIGTGPGTNPGPPPTSPPADTKPPVTVDLPPTTPPTKQPATVDPPPVGEKPRPPVEPPPPPPVDPPQPPPVEPPPPPVEKPEPPVEPPPPVDPPPPPVEETPPPPVEETPPPPVEEPSGEVPDPVEKPAEGAQPPGQDPAEEPDDLLIVNSAWTVGTA
ncbi:hypothetical protein ACIP93_33460 [Streptomyces sp. NPDC088745]|uniref:hypothetical protein n=1 Tax=Streptomyces sp. NPDC088745 TaxID=3365884 RepID=UPI0037FD52AC